MAATNYSPVTTQTGQVPSAQSNFPTLFLPSGTDRNRFRTIANGGHGANASGFDNRWSTTTALTYDELFELVAGTFNATTGDMEMWRLTATQQDGNVDYISNGDASLTTDGSSTSTWPSQYRLVYHFPNGSSLTLTDSTSHADNGTGTNTPTAGAGQIDGALSLASASTQYVTEGLGANTTVASLTVSAWVKATSFANAYEDIVGKFTSASIYWHLYVKSNGKLAIYLNGGSGNVSYDGTGSHTLSTGTWYYLTATYDNANIGIGYVNASQDGTTGVTGSLATVTAALRVGSDSGTSGREWNGLIDEVHVQNVQAPANWITTEYNNQSAPGTFAVLGTEVAVGGSSGGGPIHKSMLIHSPLTEGRLAA